LIEGITRCKGISNNVHKGMNTMKRRNVLMLFLTVILMFSIVLAGCTKSKDEGEAQTTATTSGDATNPASAPAKANADYTLPIAPPGTVTLNVAVQDNYEETASYKLNLPVWQEFEKRTGIKINWDVTNSDNYDDIMNVKLAAAQDLPDIFQLPEGYTPNKAKQDGLLLPLNDLIQKYAPNMRKYFEERPEIYNRMKFSDGNIYIIPNIVSAFAYTDPYVLFMRQDWLDALHLQRPTNLEEWYTTLKAFQDNDMNKNGIKDEVFMPNFGTEGLLYLAGSAYDMHQYFSENGFFPDKDGKVQYEYIDPRMKDMITWLNKLYTEGLINPTYLTDKSADIKTKVSKNLVGASVRAMANILVYEALAHDGGAPDAAYSMTLPPHEDGYKGTYYEYGPFDGLYGVSSKTKNPEMVIKWLDYVWASHEGNLLANFGIEGQTYTMVDGQPKLTDLVTKNPNGDPAYSVLRKLGAFPNVPLMQDSVGPSSLLPHEVLENGPKKMIGFADEVKDYLVNNSVFAFPSDEESEVISSTMPDIKTYQDETLANWITGKAPMDFDKYVSTIKSMGIDEVLAAEQAMYDRYSSGK
jgi:putative aldouronate transport system substrate-binding protein